MLPSSTEFAYPGVPPGIIKLSCQLEAKLLSKLGSISSRVEPPASEFVGQHVSG